MRDPLTIAVAELYQGIRHDHWQGKTYRQFWEWFNDRCIQLVAVAEGAELPQLQYELLQVRAAVEDAGYLVGREQLDQTIDSGG